MRQSNLQVVRHDSNCCSEPSAVESAAALLICDEMGIVGYVNSQAEQLLGIDAKATVGLSVATLLQLELTDGTALNAGHLIESVCREDQGGVRHECVLPLHDGKHIELICEMFAVAPGTVLIVFRPRAVSSVMRCFALRASCDALTGLPNRATLRERLDQLHQSAEGEHLLYSVLLIDLDHFKIINDRFGHATGDQVLAQVAQRIADDLRDDDAVGRWGGGEFLCLLPQVNRCLAEDIAERIRTNLASQPLEHEGRIIRVSASIGMATFPDDGLYPDALLAKADAALHEAKRTGRNRVQSVTPYTANAFALAHIIEKALAEGRVRPAYQTVVNLASGQVCGAEAMARILFKERQVMEAAYFIPVAEQLQLVHLIDGQIIPTVVTECVTKVLGGRQLDALFVNFSADLLRHRRLVDDILETMRRQFATCGDRIGEVKPLVIEITERQFMDDRDDVAELLRPFLDLGVRLALDDFGTGYSSLRYLADLPVSFIKLEGILVRRIASDPRVRSVVQGMCDLAQELGVTTVAEGVEDLETLKALAEIGIDWAQGYYFSTPSFRI